MLKYGINLSYKKATKIGLKYEVLFITNLRLLTENKQIPNTYLADDTNDQCTCLLTVYLLEDVARTYCEICLV